MRDASMKSTSPPAGVHASPIATPGSFGALAHLLVEEDRRSEHLFDDLRRDGERLLVALGAAPRRLAAQRADLAIEIADAGLARIAADHRPERVVGDLELLRRQTVVGDLPGREVIAGDRQLLFLGVAGEAPALPSGRAAPAESDRARSRW
jgi:hypothetical protein